MSIQNETGHAVNLAHLNKLNEKLALIDAEYTPTNNKITRANLSSGYNLCVQVQKELDDQLGLAVKPMKAREDLFDRLDDVCSRSIRHYSSTDALATEVEKAWSLVRKIRGSKKRKTLPDGSVDPNAISTSQQSYVQKEANFQKLVGIYNADPLYATTNGGIAKGDLDAFCLELKSANATMNAVISKIEEIRARRNKLMYGKYGFITMNQLVKNEVEATFGLNSAVAKEIRSIPFKMFPVKEEIL